ncbi:hypothetical protein [Kiloniella laminariae]|uniref:hypothetical protein n=1 Tax=Kiloniella laminariae TaxID=454162 RepID=UPI00146E2209|nr:hypothetical protein [Kiloniella laminariae]
MIKYRFLIGMGLLIFCIYIFFPMRLLGGLWERANIPTNFVLGETLYYNTSPSCLLVVYEVINFSDKELVSEVVKYKPFFSGQGFQYYLDFEINPDLMVGNAALSGRECIEDLVLEKQYINALESSYSVFTYSLNGARILIYDRFSNILYYATWS